MQEPAERDLRHDPRPGPLGPLWLTGEPLARRRRRLEQLIGDARRRKDARSGLAAAVLLDELSAD